MRKQRLAARKKTPLENPRDMDDSFLLSVPIPLATTIKESNGDTHIELRDHHGQGEHHLLVIALALKRQLAGHSLAVDNIENALIQNEGQSSVEIWKSFDGLHSLKSADVQNFTICCEHMKAVHEHTKVVNQGQHW